MAKSVLNDYELLTEEKKLAIVSIIDSFALTVIFLLLRRISFAILLGVLSVILHPQAPYIYRWLVAGITICSLLCWYLPLYGSSIVLGPVPHIDLRGRLIQAWSQFAVLYEEATALTRRKRMLWLLLITVYSIPLITVLLDPTADFYNVSMPFHVHLLLAASVGLAISALYPRSFTASFDDIDFKMEFVITDYRIFLSYALYSIFSLYIFFSLILK
ncbi:hypothetical protein HRbin15_02359 [bacterium HR15]|nr:hypothetical protein HRbin15_02359 [bacterium HR15]